MKKIIRLTESDLTRIVRRVINETKESKEELEREARIILGRLGYRMTELKQDSAKDLARILRRENKDRFSLNDKWEKLADKLES
jgi:DNA-directed RNA polymerase beta' subunit